MEMEIEMEMIRYRTSLSSPVEGQFAFRLTRPFGEIENEQSFLEDITTIDHRKERRDRSPARKLEGVQEICLNTPSRRIAEFVSSNWKYQMEGDVNR
jgi:hypothetical protein